MSTPANTNAEKILALLTHGEQEIAKNLGFDLEDVLAEADLLLDQSPSAD
jgi:hypothetical protein